MVDERQRRRSRREPLGFCREHLAAQGWALGKHART
jgi:hypothetical protein